MIIHRSDLICDHASITGLIGDAQSFETLPIIRADFEMFLEVVGSSPACRYESRQFAIAIVDWFYKCRYFDISKSTKGIVNQALWTSKKLLEAKAEFNIKPGNLLLCEMYSEGTINYIGFASVAYAALEPSDGKNVPFRTYQAAKMALEENLKRRGRDGKEHNKLRDRRVMGGFTRQMAKLVEAYYG